MWSTVFHAFPSEGRMAVGPPRPGTSRVRRIGSRIRSIVERKQEALSRSRRSVGAETTRPRAALRACTSAFTAFERVDERPGRRLRSFAWLAGKGQTSLPARGSLLGLGQLTPMGCGAWQQEGESPWFWRITQSDRHRSRRVLAGQREVTLAVEESPEQPVIHTEKAAMSGVRSQRSGRCRSRRITETGLRQQPQKPVDGVVPSSKNRPLLPRSDVPAVGPSTKPC